MKTITKFEAGNIYEMRFIGDSNLKVKYICVKRTAKTITFEKFQSTESINRRIKEYNGIEYILDGNYSMSPSIRANNIVG